MSEPQVANIVRVYVPACSGSILFFSSAFAKPRVILLHTVGPSTISASKHLAGQAQDNPANEQVKPAKEVRVESVEASFAVNEASLQPTKDHDGTYICSFPTKAKHRLAK
jgi:hypothetical protein